MTFIFQSPPAGPLVINPELQFSFHLFLEGMKATAGQAREIRWWPYRAGVSACVALDIFGTRSDVCITIIPGMRTSLPALKNGLLTETDPELHVIDEIDAHYVATSVLAAFGLSSLSFASGRISVK